MRNVICGSSDNLLDEKTIIKSYKINVKRGTR